MKPSHYLAFDLGAESGRAVLGRLESGRLSIREIRRFANVPIEIAGHWHWNIYGIFEEMKAAMKACASEVPGGLAAVAVDTWGVDFGLL
ncbi:MAG: rhamnulokinase, partial [Acidobacteriota bacterium]